MMLMDQGIIKEGVSYKTGIVDRQKKSNIILNFNGMLSRADEPLVKKYTNILNSWIAQNLLNE